MRLPEGFVLEETPFNLPEGFVLEAPLPTQLGQEMQAEQERGFFSNIAESWQRGSRQIESDIALFEAAFEDYGDWNEAMRIREKLQKQEQLDPIEGNFISNLFYKGARVVPGMAKGYWSAVPEAFIGMGSGALMGLAVGQVPPLTLSPVEDLPLAATGALAGAKIGLMTGSTMFWYKQGTGAMFGNMLDKGYDPEVSKTVASIAGIPYALIEMIQVKQLTPGLRMGAQKVLQKTVLNILGRAAKRYGTTLTAEVAEELGQEIIQIGAEDISAYFSKQGIPVDADYLKERASRIWQTAKESTQAMALLPVPGAAIDIATQLPQKRTRIAPEAITPAEPTVTPEEGYKPEPVSEFRPATQKQKALAHLIAREKAFISEKGKMRPGYRHLAKAMTGERSIGKMTFGQASHFIDALKRLPEPTYKKGKLVPPSISRTTKLATLKQFQREYKKPTLLRYITAQTYYAEVLGVKEIVKPLEEAKQQFDLEFRKASREVDAKISEIDKFFGTTIKEKTAARLKNQPTKAVARIRDLLNTYEEPPVNLSIAEAQIFNWFRDLNREVLRRENEVRKTLDYPPIQERKAYVRHIANGMAKEMLEGRYPFPEGKAYWAQKVVSQKIYNPMEFQRKLADELDELFTKDLAYVTKSMLWTGLKEVHLSKPLKFFNEQLGAVSKDLPIYKGLSPQEIELLQKIVVMPAETKRWVNDYVNQVIKGQETWFDQQVNNLVTETGLGGLLNKVLKPFGRTISQKPITITFQKGGRLIISGVMGWRPKQLIRNKFQIIQNLALYGIKANLKSFMPASPQLQKIIDNSLFIKGYTGFEELPKALMGKLERVWLAPYQWTAVSNATQAMKAAYWDTMELIESPKYKELGWADPKRTYKEKSEFLYPSEKAKIIREMEHGASCTQYQYIPMGMPEIFRYRALIPFTRLQSWWMNHFAKFHREAAHRTMKGEPMWSDGTVKLPWSRRLGWFRYLAIGGLVLNTLGYTRSFLFGAAPTMLPPAAQLALASYAYLTSFFSGSSEKWKEWQRQKAKHRFYNALKTFTPGYLAYKDFEAIWSGRKNLKSLFFYTKLKKRKTSSLTGLKPLK